MTMDLEKINREAAELEEHYKEIAPLADMALSRMMRDDLEALCKLTQGSLTLSTRGEMVLKHRVAYLELENEELKERLK